MKNKPIWTLVAALIPCGWALCGCGQKGPLYLPEHNEVVITAPVSESTEATPQPLPEETTSPPSSSSASSSSKPPKP
jgi:predicted small lipoprotein YifL